MKLLSHARAVHFMMGLQPMQTLLDQLVDKFRASEHVDHVFPTANEDVFLAERCPFVRSAWPDEPCLCIYSREGSLEDVEGKVRFFGRWSPKT